MLGGRYCEFLTADGLDPNNFHQNRNTDLSTLPGGFQFAILSRERLLSGRILRTHLRLSEGLSWSVLRYTNPDVPFVQADENKLFGFDPLAVVEKGEFMALQIHMSLGTAAYATMTLREVTKAETGSHYQSALTQASEDQKFKKPAEIEPMDVDASVD